MKLLRIFAAIVGTIGLIGMFSCGGSGYLAESPSLLSSDSVVLRFHAVGLDSPTVASDQANQSSLAKAFFAEDTFSGDGYLAGEDLTESIQVDCQFDAPVVAAIDGGQPGPAAISVVADDPATCADTRNCCVYSIDGTWADPCTLTVECIIDPALTDLANTQLDLGFDLRQFMTTNMQDDTGLIVTAIIEEAETAGAIPTDRSIFAVDTASINRSGCTGAASSDTFLVNDDDPWAAIPGAINGPDILNHGDYLWNVDTIGAVDIAGGVGDVSECTMYYENIAGSVSLEPISRPIPVDVEEYILMDGSGRICNSQSHTDCEGDSMVTFDLTLDMYDPAVQGDDLTFAQAGISGTCASSEINNTCTGTGVLNMCLPYVINGRPPAPSGCETYCIDITGLTDPGITPTSQIAQYADTISFDADPTGALCTAANGTMIDVGNGSEDTCLPNQMVYCLLGGDPSPYTLTTDDLYTVYDDTLSGADKSTAEYLDYIFQTMANVDASNLWDPVEGAYTLLDLYHECAAEGSIVQLVAEQHLGQLDPSYVDGDDCYDVAERFLNDPTLAPASRSLRNQMSLDFITKHGVDYMRIFYEDPWVQSGPSQRQLFEDQTVGITEALLGSIVPGGAIGVSLVGVPLADRHLYSSLASGASPTMDPEVYINGNLTVSWVDPAQIHSGLGNGTANHFVIFVEMEEDSGANQCGDGVSGDFGFYLHAVGYCANLDTYQRNFDDYNIAVSPSLPNEETGEANLNSIFLTSAQVDALAGASDPDTPAEWEIGVDKTMRELEADCSTRGGLAAIPYSMDSEEVVNPNDPVCQWVLRRFLTDGTKEEINTGNRLLLHPLKIAITEVDLGVPYGIEQYIDVEVIDGDSSTYQRLFNVFEEVEDGLPDTILHPDADPIPRGWFVANPDDRAAAQWHLPKVPPDGNPGGVDGQPLSIYTEFYEENPPSGLWYPLTAVVDFQPITAPGTDMRFVKKVSASFDIHRAEKDRMIHSNTPFEYFMFISLGEPVDENGALIEPGHSDFCSFDGTGVVDLHYLVDGRCVDDILPSP